MHTPGPWRGTVEDGDGKCKHTNVCKTFSIESDTRRHLFTTQAWKSADDPDIFEEVMSNMNLVVAAPTMLKALKIARQNLVDASPAVLSVIDEAILEAEQGV